VIVIVWFASKLTAVKSNFKLLAIRHDFLVTPANYLTAVLSPDDGLQVIAAFRSSPQSVHKA
jgi:hypothetical protein